MASKNCRERIKVVRVAPGDTDAVVQAICDNPDAISQLAAKFPDMFSNYNVADDGTITITPADGSDPIVIPPANESRMFQLPLGAHQHEPSGYKHNSSIDLRAITLPGASLPLIDSNTVTGVIGPEGFVNITIPECGQFVEINTAYNIKQLNESATAPNVTDFIVMRPQINIDGGAWTNLITGGQDEFWIVKGQNVFGELLQIDFARTANLAGGTHTIGYRLLLTANNLQAGSVFDPTTSNAYVRFITENS